MARKKGKIPEPFHNPFLAVREQLEASVGGERAVAVSSNPPAEPAAHLQEREPDDETLFFREMAGVEPLSGGEERIVGRPAARPTVGPSEEDRALSQLQALVSGEVAFEITDTAEYVEGIVQGLDRRLLQKLRKGGYSVQAHLDLHGLTREEAKHEVGDFLVEARRYGMRCVLIVSGRGLHSPEGKPILKTSLVEWLTGRRMAKHVLAFCSARPCDGGLGALYVLLRR